jgi:3-deoxy-D-manno-octulosonic acid (KDO) 8-phosphate synthase
MERVVLLRFVLVGETSKELSSALIFYSFLRSCVVKNTAKQNGASGGNRTLVAALARQSITTMLHSLVKKVRTSSDEAPYSRE